MESTAKYFPQTAAALAELKESLALLEETAAVSAEEKQQLSLKLAEMRRQITQKAARIEEIIATLNGASN